ncbi:alpha/beta hydrolase [Pseudaestuariivita rosea]|uniref:alpha/beta hydrolase n=1 Tax=Pseudaestuariivita rosea TaxID=2763263 RepID=UPI001ABB3CD0|nr:alpha/beta hydrolase [Pseudaestuariivita rosea]
MNTYQGSASWLQYREILAEQFDINFECEPVETWRSIRGHDIHIDEWQPEEPKKGTFILVHGAGGNGRVLAPFAAFAAKQGWHVLAPDLPGYGLTQPAKGFRWEYEEWPAVVADLADECTGHVVLMGLSLGGMTAVFAAEATRNVSGIIATTLLDMGDPGIFIRAARWRWLGLATLLGFHLMPWIVDRVAMPLWLIAPMNKMTGGAAMRDYFSTDRLLGRLRIPSRFFRKIYARKAVSIRLRCPLLLVHPGADAWTPTPLSKLAFDRVRGDKRLREMTNGSHLPLEQPALQELQQEVRSFLTSIAKTSG